jgi:hypothetical protein
MRASKEEPHTCYMSSRLCLTGQHVDVDWQQADVQNQAEILAGSAAAEHSLL